MAIEQVEKRISLVGKGEAEMYKVILLDFSMPFMDGPEVATRIIELIKESPHLSEEDVPFICCCSAYTDPSFKQRALDAGMNHFLNKPVSHDDLVKIVNIFK